VPADIQVMIGSQWWCLRRRTVEAVLDFIRERPDVVRFFRTTWIPDETFFQTLVRHLVPDREIVSRSLTFKMFSDYGMPVTFYNDQYDLLISQDYLFARKISPEARVLEDGWARSGCRTRTDFTVSQEGPKLYDFLTGRGRVGRRFGTRFWERESTLGPDRELFMLVCKKWHVAKRMLHAAEDRLQVRGIEYLFDEATCPVPHLGGIERTLEKRNRHRRALMRMLFDYYDTDRLMICLDPANIDLMRDFMSDRANARILELQCVFDDQYLVGHARRVGLATDRTPDEVIERMLPTLRHEFADQSVRIREAEFQQPLARAGGSRRAKTPPCSAILQHRRRYGLCPGRDTLSVRRLKEAGAHAYAYDDQNIFAKILRGEIPNDTVMETEHTLAFNDIRPQSPVHVLVIPKGAYVTFDHFAAEASEAEIADFHRVAARIIAEIGIGPGAGGMGYRTLSNAGEHAVQEVPHYHMHILAGRPLGRMLQPA
jgi:diadenosine tetraphosphate (Ap4A) HIT family hydrolase